MKDRLLTITVTANKDNAEEQAALLEIGKIYLTHFKKQGNHMLSVSLHDSDDE